MTAFFLGFILDMLLGDPYWLPHPIRLIGSFITLCEKWLRGKENEKEENGKSDRKELRQGGFLVLLVLGAVLSVTAVLLLGAYRIHPYAGLLLETVMTYQILAAKCLKVESMKVCKCLKENDPEGARRAVSMIVGRDTQCLDEAGITRAAVETVAENTSDGVIAPMLYTALGGPVAGFFYKAVNTMDSMVGYKNEKYLFFGRTAARLDDLVNYIPSRISAYLMIAASFPAGRDFDGRRALRIYRRDNRRHASPNSAQTESVCAGALGVRLAGDASYFGKIVKKPYIGDDLRPIEPEDIRRTNRLMYLTAWLCEGICLLIMALAAFAG